MANFITPVAKPVGYTMKPSDYKIFVDNLINLQDRITYLESLPGGALSDPTNVPIGGVIIWTQSSGDIPEGWQVADGTNGTVDLQGMFIYGASSDEEVGTTGGALTHVHTNPSTSSVGNHTHSGSGNTGGASATTSVGAGSGAAATTSGHYHSFSFTTSAAGGHSHSVGNTGSASNLPPCKLFYFIERIS